MNFTAARQWTAGLVGAAALVLGTAQITAAAPDAAPSAATTTQEDFAREGQPNIYTNNVDRQSRFYQQLGFTELFRFTFPDGTVAFATLQKGPFYLTFSHLDTVKAASGLHQLGRSYFKQLDVTVITADVDGLIAKLRSQGTKVLMAPKEQPWGERQAYVLDPEGGLVQISTHRGH